jgi:hypothetical protein
VKSPDGGGPGTKIAAVPFPQSICHRCTALRTIATKASDFLMCTALPTKYPSQPVLTCPAFIARS